MSKHPDPRAYLAFLAKTTALLAEYSREELEAFRLIAEKSYPAMAALVRAAMDVAAAGHQAMTAPQHPGHRSVKNGKPLRDLLCSTDLFPSNGDLIAFAKRALPEMNARGLGGRSRKFIAGRVMSHLEAINGGKRDQLEQSMREAIELSRDAKKKQEPQSFFAQWERIIKGMGR